MGSHVRCRWLRMEPSHRHGGVSSGDPQKTFLGHFSTIWWFWRRGSFRREAHPGGTSFPVAPGGAGAQRIRFSAGLGANGSPPTAVMSLQVSAPTTQSCAPHQAGLSLRARQWGWGSLESCFQQNQELAQPLNRRRGPGCGPHHARKRHSDALKGRALVVSGE